MSQLDFNITNVYAYMKHTYIDGVLTKVTEPIGGRLKIYTPSGQIELSKFFGKKMLRFEDIELTKEEVDKLSAEAKNGRFCHYSFTWGSDYINNHNLDAKLAEHANLEIEYGK